MPQLNKVMLFITWCIETLRKMIISTGARFLPSIILSDDTWQLPEPRCCCETKASITVSRGGIVASGPQCRFYTKEVVGARIKTKWASKHWLFVTCSYFHNIFVVFFPTLHLHLRVLLAARCVEPAGGVGVFQIWWAPVVWALELIEKGSRNPWNPCNRNYQEPQVPHPQTWIYICWIWLVSNKVI